MKITAKRARTEYSVTHVQLAPSADANPPSIIVTGENQGMVDQLAGIMTQEAAVPALTLAHLPLEVLTLVTRYLPARDIVNLSHCARFFRQALTLEQYGSSISDISRHIVKWGKAYDEKTQTLDLNQAFINRPAASTYVAYLRRMAAALTRHSQWARVHIKALVLPLEPLYRWKLKTQLDAIFPCLTGVTHLYPSHSIPSSHNSRTIQTLSDPMRKNLLTNLAAFKVIPAQKLTIRNSIFITYLQHSLCQAINQKLFNPALEQLVFQNDEFQRERWYFSIAITKHAGYPHLSMLDVSSSQIPTIYLNSLPDTITCLCINNTTTIQGHASSIKRLEILNTGSATLRVIEQLSVERYPSQPTLLLLPELKEIHIVSPPRPDQHAAILNNLMLLPPRGLSITLSSLHVHALESLNKLMLTNTISLLHHATFYLDNAKSILDFGEMAQQGVFRQLTHIHYRLEAILSSALPEFIRTLTRLLNTAALPNVNRFTIEYQHPQIHYQPFLQSEGMRSLLQQNFTRFTLQQIQPQFSVQSLADYFTALGREAGAFMQQQMIDGTKQEIFFTTLSQKLTHVITGYQDLMTGPHTCREWATYLQYVHFDLYRTYQQQLVETGINFLPFHIILPQSFFETAQGKQFGIHVQKLLLTELADTIYRYLDLPLLTMAGLRKYSTVVDTNGFSLNFTLSRAPGSENP